MQLYLVERTDKWSYDDYDKFVCWANSAEEAKRIHADPNEYYEWKEDGWYSKSHGTKEKYHAWVDNLDNLKVYELSRPPEKPTVVLASFNAG